MKTDWKMLAPHHPLNPGAAAYVEPPTGGGKAIANWILAGGTTVLLGGPAGVGKSTELAAAAKLLESTRVSCLVPLDLWENMRRVTADQLLLRIAGRVVSVALEVLKLELSYELRSALMRAGVLSPGLMDPAEFSASPESLVNAALAEVSRLSKQKRIALLIDGLEKVPHEPIALELFDALGKLPASVDLVVVIPWHAAFGPRSETVVRPGERLEMLRAPEVEGDAGAPGRAFLRDILTRRLPAAVKLDEPVAAQPLLDLIEAASIRSGGLPRIFLQLVADAGTYAKLRAPADWPSQKDLHDAIADQQDSFRRLLLPGDVAAINAADGTAGLELELDRKVRLMAHGVLLERMTPQGPILRVHPLARAALQKAGTNA